LIPTMPQAVYDERRVDVEQIVETVKVVIKDFDTMLTNIVHTWSNLAVHPDKVKIQV